MRKIKKVGIVCLAVMIAASFLFQGCGYTREQRQQINSYRKVGEANAINYVEEKYGFTPKVKSVENIYSDSSVPTLTPMPTYDVRVVMEYDGREFTVEIPGNEENTRGKDDYQKDEILAYLKDYILDACPQADEVALPYLERDSTLFGPYFTGDNFDDYISDEDYRSSVLIKLCDKNVYEFPVDDFVSKVHYHDLTLINYNDKDVMPTPEADTYCSLYKYGDIVPYITQIRRFEKAIEGYSEETLDVYELAYDDILIYTEENEEITMETLAGEDSDEYGKCLGAYHVQTNAKDVQIYIPKSLFGENEEITVIVGESSKELIHENDEYYYFANLSIIEDSDEFVSTYGFRIYAKEIEGDV